MRTDRVDGTRFENIQSKKGGPMKLKQINISLENRHGRLYEVSRALGDLGINIRALNLVDSGAFGQLRILVSDWVAARRYLMEKHLPAKIDDVVAVEIEDRPGSLADMLEHLYHTDINVQYSYAYVGGAGGNAIMIFNFNDNDRAVRILGEKNYRIMNAEDFGITEAET
jgi:hypothetical protein